MGQAVVRLFKSAKREITMYDIERRAEKIISKEKPTPAPMHESSIKELERMDEENVSKEYLNKKNEQLDEYLKKVYVTSPDPAPSMKRIIHPDRPLPVKRQYTDDDLSYGYRESEENIVPIGKVSLKQALQFISDHQSDPKIHTNTSIAEKYKLPINVTDDILEHFKMFSVKVPNKSTNLDKLPEFDKLVLRVKQMNMLNVKEVVEEFEKAAKKENTQIEADNKPLENVKTEENSTINEDSNKKKR